MDRPSSHSHKVPYARKEGRKSLFSKMKDSVRDMLSPSWLSELVHNVKKDPSDVDKNSPVSSGQGKGILPGSPMMSDMEISQQSTVVTTGQFCMPSSGTHPTAVSRDPTFNRGPFLGNGQPRTLDFAGLRPNDTMASPFQRGNFPPPLAEFTSAQLPLARLTEKSDSIMAQEDTLSQRSDGSKSTSGCSSMLPPPDVSRHDTTGDKRKASEHGSVGTISPHEQQAAKRQRMNVGGANNQLFTRRLSDTFMNKASTSAVSHRPAFNTTLFGSPLTDEASLLGSNVLESSFYPGRTKFGGRSSLSFRSQKNTVNLNQSLPGRLTVPVKAFMKAKPRNHPNKEAVTSSTAKRILEALDKMPTPLNDAKKIPMVPRQWTESPSFFAKDRPASRSGPPTQKLNISSQISISKNRQVSFAPLGQPRPSTSRVPEQTVSKPTRQETVILDTESAPSGKMRREKSYHRGSASVKTTLAEEDTVIIPDLQTDFTLPVGSMPKFSFAAPSFKPKSQEPVTQSRQRESVSASAESPVKQSLKFTFSSPIIEPIPSNKPASPQKYGAFQFSSPLTVEKKTESSTEATDFNKPFIATPLGKPAGISEFSFSSPANKIDYSFSTAPKPKPKINGPTEDSTGGFQAATELKKGSVMDILGGGSFKPSSTSGSQSSSSTPGTGGAETTKTPPLSSLFKQQGWNCDVCLLSNKNDASKCVACQTPKPGGQVGKETSASKSSATSEPPKSDLFAKFQQPSGSWTCDVCLIQNIPDVSKCVACQTPKPGAASSSSPLKSSIQPGNWICKSCLIQNKQADTVCGACKTTKSSTKESEIKKSDSLFGKLKPAVGSWECEMCLVQNKKDVSTCVACQTPKPLKFFKHPPGDWTCDTCLVSNKETAVNCVACNYARPGPPRTQAVPSIAKSYTLSQTPGFSMPSTSESKTGSTGGFKFATPAVSTSTPSGFDVAKINDSAKTSDNKPVTGGFTFRPDSSSAPAGSGFKFGNSASSESDKSSTANAKATGFKFGSSDSKSDNTDGSLKSAGFQFGKSDSTSSSVSSATSTPVSTVAFAFGQKSDNLLPSTASTGGLTFGQKSDSSALNDKLQAATSVPGGFTFKTSDSLNSSKSSETETTKTATTSSQSIGGFNFKTVTSTSNPIATSSNSIGAFTSTKNTEPTSLSGISKPSESCASGVSVFPLSQSGSNTSLKPFSFAQKPAPTTSPNKRGREDDTVEPDMKKAPFSFGQTVVSTSSSTFQFGAATTSSSNSVFAFGQKPTTTSTSTGLFAFGQQNSTPASNTETSVFGQSAPASKPVPSVFGQQNAAVTTASSGSSTFVFGGSGQKSTSESNATIPVFGQTNSVATTSAASTPSMFQFGQTNNTASAAPAFNFNAQSSGQSSVFGSSTPSFNFSAQKTEAPTTAAAAPGLFKFGSSQPAPATTPAFGSASAFGSSSTPAFGTGSIATGAFSGNAPSTTPAFGSTPPAFGSSNSNTGQAPAFGDLPDCRRVDSDYCITPETEECTRYEKSEKYNSNDSVNNTECNSIASETSQPESPTVNSANQSESNSEVDDSQSDSTMNNTNQSDSTAAKSESNLTIHSWNQSKSNSTVNNSSEESFFHGCYEDLQEEIDRTEYNPAVCIDIGNTGLNFSDTQEPSGQTIVNKGLLIDDVCQTEGLIEQKSATTQTDQLENLRYDTSSSACANLRLEEVNTDIPLPAKKECSAKFQQDTVSLPSMTTKVKSDSTGITADDTDEGHCVLSQNSSNRTCPVLPSTGVANEPLTCGRLFVVPSMKKCLDSTMRISPALTQPLMTCKLITGISSGCGTVSVGQSSCTNSSLTPVFRFGATQPAGPSSSKNSVSPCHFSSGSSVTALSPVYGNTGSSVTAVSPVFGNVSMPASTAWSPVFGNVSMPAGTAVSPVFGNVSMPASTAVSPVFGNVRMPASTAWSPMFVNAILPASKALSPVLGNVNLKASTGLSQPVGNVSTPANMPLAPVFGNANRPTSTALSPVFCNVSLPANTALSSVFGNVTIPTNISLAPVFGNVNRSTVLLSVFSNVSLPASTVLSPVFGNVSRPDRTAQLPVFRNASLTAKPAMSPVFGNVSRPTSMALSPMFGNVSQGTSMALSSMFGNVSRATSMALSPVFGNVSMPVSKGLLPLFGNGNRPASTAWLPVFGNVSSPASAVQLPVFGNVSRPASTAVLSVFGDVGLQSSAVQSPVSCNVSRATSSNNAGSTVATNLIMNKAGFVLNMPKLNRVPDQFKNTTMETNKPSSSPRSILFGINSAVLTSAERKKQLNFHLQSHMTGFFQSERIRTNSVKPFSCGSRENTDMQTDVMPNDLKGGVEKHTEFAAGFSFHSPAAVEDVVMEECKPVSTAGEQGGSEQPAVLVEAPRRVAFSFSPPQVANENTLSLKQPSPIGKANKSILKTKTREMVTAFDAATVCGNKEGQGNSEQEQLGAVVKEPSVPSLFGGKKTFGDVGLVNVCDSKSMPLKFGMKTKVEFERGLDTASTSAEQEQQMSMNSGSKGSKSSPNIHSWFFPVGKTNMDQNSTSSVKFALPVLHDGTEPTLRKSVNFERVTAVDSHSDSFPSTQSSVTSSTTSPPIFKIPDTFAFSGNSILKTGQPETTTVIMGSSFSPAPQNLFAFSGNTTSLSKKTSACRNRREKITRRKIRNKHSAIGAFSGLTATSDKSVTEPSRSASSCSKSSGSSNSGSDISRSSISASSSSDSDHSVSSSSSSDRSDDCEDNIDQSGSLPMEEDGNRDNENKSWNACPLEEKYWYSCTEYQSSSTVKDWTDITFFLFNETLPKCIYLTLVTYADLECMLQANLILSSQEYLPIPVSLQHLLSLTLCSSLVPSPQITRSRLQRLASTLLPVLTQQVWGQAQILTSPHRHLSMLSVPLVHLLKAGKSRKLLAELRDDEYLYRIGLKKLTN